MKVTAVSASVRYSRALEDGSHKTVELSAEAALAQSESWQEAQAKLYQDLGNQLKTLWMVKANGNGHHTEAASASAANGEMAVAESAAHHCEVHGVEFKRFEKNGKAWYSHRAADKWCNER